MKHARLRFPSAALLAVFAAFWGCRSAGGSGFKETQGFMDFEVRGSISDQWSYFVNHQSKVRDRAPEYYVWHFKAGVRYRPVSWLRLAVDHRYQEERGGHDWGRERRTTLEATPAIRLGNWRFSSRNQMECRDFESPKTDRWRYRNQFTAEHPLPFWGLSGYVSEEPHYDFEANRWNKHRVTVGISRKMTSWLSGKLYYRWDIVEQSKNPGHWDKTQIFGIALVADLDRLLERG